MPFDSKPILPPEPKFYPYSIDGFIAWLERRDPLERYKFTSVTDCAHAQFARACDVDYQTDSKTAGLIEHWACCAHESYSPERTFGALLAFAREHRHQVMNPAFVAKRRLSWWKRFLKSL